MGCMSPTCTSMRINLHSEMCVSRRRERGEVESEEREEKSEERGVRRTGSEQERGERGEGRGE